ncbi:MAG: hypothetical protein NT009_13845 [Proteobacteria bacterium]|nr:hypothetical protein [Pseudomonadota bacterium]
MPIFDKPLYQKPSIISNGIHLFILSICLMAVFILFDQQAASFINGFSEEPNPSYYHYLKQYLPPLTSFWGALTGLYDYLKQKYIKYSGIAFVLNLLILALYSLTLLF